MKPEILFFLIVPLSLCLANLRDFDLDGFAAMIQAGVTESDNFVLPKDNQQMTEIEDEDLYYFGTFDFIVVGAGSAGTLLTRRLLEIAGWRILLLEAGGQENDFSDVPAMAPYLQASDMNWGYFTVPQSTCCLGMENQSCIAPRGKVLGGSSVINAKIYARGSKHDYDLWAEQGNYGWSYEEVLPYFKKTENCLVADVDPGYHLAGGLLSVNQFEPHHYTNIYLEAMSELGHQIRDHNGEESLGVSQLYSTFSDVGISSGGRAFIDPVLNHTNLNVTLRAFVTKIIIDNSQKAEGVEFIKNGKKYVAYATKEIILSAGSINTPQILMLSGIGPKEVLSTLDIDIIKDLPVGKNLQDHPNYIGLLIKTNHSEAPLSLRQASENYLHHKRPWTASYAADSHSFIKLNNATQLPDIQQLIIVPSSSGRDPGKALNLNQANAESFRQTYSGFSDILVRTILLHEKSRGSVTLKSKDVKDFPLIDYNYFSDTQNEDIELLYQGVLKGLQLLNTKTFKAMNATFAPFDRSCQEHELFSKDYWYCSIRSISTTFYHPVGTTRMGTSEADSVVDPELRVHGIQRLRIVDAGVIPEIPSGNTNAPTYMIAEKAADLIKKTYGVL